MSGRRAHVRYGFVSGLSGSVRVTRAVMITNHLAGEITAVSQTPEVVDAELSLELSTGSEIARAIVRVVSSRQVVLDGALRHEIRLREIESDEQHNR